MLDVPLDLLQARRSSDAEASGQRGAAPSGSMTARAPAVHAQRPGGVGLAPPRYGLAPVDRAVDQMRARAAATPTRAGDASQAGGGGEAHAVDDLGAVVGGILGGVGGAIVGGVIGGVPGALAGGVVGAGVGAVIGSALSGPAVPTNLVQSVTSWTPGPSKYGFQLSFACSSSSGRVADLQSQSTLRWREYVTYSRNDFAHRISPSNPTILPPGGGIPFTSPTATAASTNNLVFNTAQDTHWMPTSAVRIADFAPTATPPRTLPAIMESSQVYQYSTDGSTWTTFAGPFTLRRTLAPTTTGGHTFTTNKVGIHSVTENYKP